MKLSRYKHDSDFSYAFGATIVFELAKTHPELISRAFLRPNLEKRGEKLDTIISLLNQLKIEVIESTKAFNILGAKDSCLLIAEFKKPTATIDMSENVPHIVLVNPSDSGNLGTIIRSAVAFSYQNLAIITPAVDPYDPKTIRASMGAVFHINIQQYTDFASYQNQNPTRQLYSFMLNQNAQTLANAKPNTANYSLIFGNEASGLPAEFGNITTPIFIPQSANVDSLNLSVAASIAMYDFSQKK